MKISYRNRFAICAKIPLRLLAHSRRRAVTARAKRMSSIEAPGRRAQNRAWNIPRPMTIEANQRPAPSIQCIRSITRSPHPRAAPASRLTAGRWRGTRIGRESPDRLSGCRTSCSSFPIRNRFKHEASEGLAADQISRQLLGPLSRFWTRRQAAVGDVFVARHSAGDSILRENS